MSLMKPSAVGEVEITPMRKRDLKHGVLETERHTYPTPWSPAVFESEIDQMRGGSRYYVTARRGEPTGSGLRRRAPIVGHAGLWFSIDEAHVTNVAVHPDARRSGVATALMLATTRADEGGPDAAVGFVWMIAWPDVRARLQRIVVIGLGMALGPAITMLSSAFS